MWRREWKRAFVGAALVIVSSPVAARAGTCILPDWNSQVGAGSPMPAAVHAHGFTTAAGYIYAVSGSDTPPPSGGSVDLIQRYDPATNTWSTNFATVPVPVAGASLAYDAAGVGDGPRLLLFGGANASGTTLSLVQIYTFRTNLWTTGTPLPGVRSGMSSRVLGGRVYLVGGLNVSGVAQAQNWEYDFSSQTYTDRAPLPSAVARAASAVADGKLFVISGRDVAGNLVDHNYAYTPPPIDAWTTRAPIPTTVAAAGAETLGAMTAECNGDIIIIGGGTPFGANKPNQENPSRAPGSTNAVQLYDLPTDSWSAGPSLPTARFAVRAAQSGNTLIAFGGWDGTSTVTTVDRIQGPPLPVDLDRFYVE